MKHHRQITKVKTKRVDFSYLKLEMVSQARDVRKAFCIEFSFLTLAFGHNLQPYQRDDHVSFRPINHKWPLWAITDLYTPCIPWLISPKPENDSIVLLDMKFCIQLSLTLWPSVYISFVRLFHFQLLDLDMILVSFSSSFCYLLSVNLPFYVMTTTQEKHC